MVNAHVSSRVFAGLLPQMMRAGIDAGFQAAAADAVVDELRHARLCAAVVEALGGEARAPLPDLDEVPRHEDVTRWRRCCATCSRCLPERDRGGRAAGEQPPPATESTLRRVLTGDPRRRGRPFAAGLADAAKPGAAYRRRMRARLGAYLVPAFAPAVRAALHGVEHPARCGRVLGVEDRRDSTSLFIDVVNEVIVPRLEAFDLPARQAVEAALAARRRRASDRHRRPIAVRAATDTARLRQVASAVRRPPTYAFVPRRPRDPPGADSSDQDVGEAPARGPSRGGPCSAPRLPSMIAQRDGRRPRSLLGWSRRGAPHRSGRGCPAGKRASTPRWTRPRAAGGAATGWRATSSRPSWRRG